jgi:molybdate transport system regulatory protein
MTAKSNYAKQGSTTSTKNNKLELITYSYKKYHLHMKIKSKIWIETDEGILISEGRIQLLKLIESTGSLNKAAKEMNISYQKAWKLIDASNKASKEPLIATQVGGNKGGGTVITPYGKSLIESFEAINVACWEFLDLELKKHSL